MIPLTLQEIAAATSGRLAGADPGTLVAGPLSFDSRAVHPGGLFACLPGTRTDGHDFAAAAVADGAVAVLASSPVAVPAVYVQDVTAALGDIARAVADRYNGLTLALTGSAGKTSAKDLLLSVLQLAGPTVANVKSFNNEIGFPSTVLRTEESTRYLVLEMGARGKGHITYLTGIARPHVSAVLNVGTAHLGEFGSREGIAEAKAEIVQALPLASEGGVAVLNGDDELVRAMADKTAAKVLFFGTGPDCDVRAEDITLSGGRPSFALHAGGHSAAVSPDVFGGHHVTNALAAAALALAAGVPFETVARGLDGARIVSGARMEVTDRPDGVTVVNDAFNASPEATRAALDSLAHLASGRPVVAVLGEMMELGEQAEEIHRSMGALAAARGVGRLITVGGPNAAAMGEAAGEAGVSAVEHVVGREDVLPLLEGHLPPKVVILVKGAHSLALDEIAATLTTTRE